MPVKNAGIYLKPCLESILAQSYTDWELIAINDGSTDGSEKVLLEYADCYSNIITSNSEGTGIIKALQKAYKVSNGDYIHRMDADDLMPVNKLKLMREACEMGSVVTGKVAYFCDEQEIGEGFSKYTTWLNGLMESGDFWRDVYKECPVPSSAWMMHRSDFKSIGGFNSSLMPEDYDLSFRILKYKLKLVCLESVVHLWRDSSTRTSRNEEQYFPIAYIPIKVHYFLELHRDTDRELVLWGAGKKGKLIAKHLINKRVPFSWVTGNPKKQGANIYETILEDEASIRWPDSQVILALSSPQEQNDVQQRLDSKGLVNNEDYFWFF